MNFRRNGKIQQMNSLHKQFEQFVVDSQFTELINIHKLQSVDSVNWETNVILYYDLLIAYFLKKYQQIHIISDDQLRLELKQYFFRSPIELRMFEQEDGEINKGRLINTYNREINIAGFLLKTPLGYVKNSKFMAYSNILLNLYSKTEDLMKPYVDNRVIVMKILLNYFQPIQTNMNTREILLSDLKYKNNIQISLNELFDNYLSYLRYKDNPAKVLLDFVSKVQGQSRNFWENKDDISILQFLQEKQLILMLLKYTFYVENDKKMVLSDSIYNDSTIQLQRNILQFKDYDKQFDLRVLQYLYKLSFGVNILVQRAKTLDDFYSVIPGALVPIMQEKLRQQKQRKEDTCNHCSLKNLLNNTKDEQQVRILIEMLNLYQKEPQKENEKDVVYSIKILDKEYKFNLDMLICIQCSEGIVCYHQIIQTLFQYEFISLQEYETLITPFMQRDMSIFVHNSFCLVCGAAFPLKIDMQQIYENLDPLKKYKVIAKAFKVLFGALYTQFQFPLSYFIEDFIQKYYYILKDELFPFKQQVNYLQKKVEVVYLFVSAYLYSIKGDNVFVDIKFLFRYSKLKDLQLQQFSQQVQQITQKFQIQSSIVIPSQVTVNHLFANQFRKPIVGIKIKRNPHLITELIQQNAMLYPSLYEMDRFLQYFNKDIKTLSQDVINRVIETSAVDIQNRKSSVVDIYQIIKNNYGRHMERNSNKLTNRHNQIGIYIFQQIPIDFCILNSKDLFYIKYCYKTKLPHQLNEVCEKCGLTPKKTKDIQQISDKQYESDFFKFNQLVSKPQFKYPETDNKLAFPTDYSNQYLYNLSKELGVSYFQVVNLGGFSYLEISVLGQFGSFDQLVEYQLKQFTETCKIPCYSPQINDTNIPKDLKFILKLQKKNYNFNLFNTRILYIRSRILDFLQSFGETSLIISIIEDFNKRYIKLLAQGNATTNFFLNCQLMTSYLFQHVYPELKKQINSTILQQQIKQMFKDDLTLKDQTGEQGAFRLKTTKQVNAEALQAEMKEFKREYIVRDLDEDNDYVDGYKKNTALDDNDDNDQYD